MLPLPGLMAMPTVLLNAALSLVRERGVVSLGPDRLAAFVPMFDEAEGAERALRSLLGQDESPDELVVSINGGSDATPEVVDRTLAALGLEVFASRAGETGSVTTWRSPDGATAVTVVRHSAPTSKAISLNLALQRGHLTADRVLVLDGDTALAPGFVRAIRRSFYRLRYERLPSGGHGYVLEDTALQSGAVRSSPGASLQARLISLGRDAEYAFSAVVRSGQCARLGRVGVFGRSRLFTAVGCGFVARRDVLPMPADTLTEDHDLTLTAQGLPDVDVLTTAGALEAGGHTVEVGGRQRPLGAVIGPSTPVLLRRGGTARFVAGAVMRTEDPPRLGGFLRQVERWNGGAIENALKRLGQAVGGGLGPNVAFTVAAAQLENLLGLFLALLLPVLLGLRYAWPQAGAPAAVLAAWLGIDLLAAFALSLAGSRRLGDPWPRAAAVAALGVVPLLALRALGALAYLTAATRILPAALARRVSRRARAARVQRQRTWARPTAQVAATAHLRTAGVAATVLLLGLTVFGVAAHLARAYVEQNPAWRYVYGSPRLEQADFELLPIVERQREPSFVTTVAYGGAGPTRWTSPYCPPSAIGRWEGVAPVPEGLDPQWLASDRRYEPLSPWGLLMLARLAPLLSHLHEASAAYGVDAGFLLQVLLNESYLDPLARGPTDDVGLAQLTSDALTLVAAVSAEEGNPLFNRALFAGEASVFDPEFSLCAGAAKLAWAQLQPGGDDRRVAYALYVNPFDGAENGNVAATHVDLVAALGQLEVLVERLAAAIQAYRSDPALLRPQERALLDVSSQVGLNMLSLREAYLAVADLVARFRIDDRRFYERVLTGLYGPPGPELDISERLAVGPRSH